MTRCASSRALRRRGGKGGGHYDDEGRRLGRTPDTLVTPARYDIAPSTNYPSHRNAPITSNVWAGI
eukprot:872366-Pyramimonas_sp.AAC.1